jgi:two-component system OmpR family response regulator
MGGTHVDDQASVQKRESAVKHVLVVDDDPAMRGMIADYLAGHNLRVSSAADGRGMTDVLTGGDVDLVILDLKLGKEDGLDLVRRLRGNSPVPIIVITGHRRDEVDRIIGLELGADDYLVKPFGLRELLARLRAVLRRSVSTPNMAKEDKRTRYRFAGWELSMRTRRLTSPGGDVLPLTKGEFSLLAAFLQSPQRVLSREALLAASRVHGAEVFDRSIDVQILRLRRKLESDPSLPALIKTERGVGYIFTAAVETD